MSDSGSMNLDLGVNLGVTLDGAGLQELSNTIKEISKGKDLQKYWKDVESATDSAAKAIERYSKNVNSKGLAENLLKQINALKALTKKENLSELFPNMELNLDELVESAKKIVPQISSQFSVDSFSQAFKTFDLLKEKSIDLTEAFRKLADYAELVDENYGLRKENSQFRNLIGDSDVEEVKSKLLEIKKLRDEASETFKTFLKSSNVVTKTEDGYGSFDYDFDDYRFERYFEAIREGSMTAQQAIADFKLQYDYLLIDNKNNNSNFGLEQLQAFSNKLDSIFRQVEETSTKINDIISNGVITKSVENLSMDSSLSDSQRSLFGNLLQDEESLKSITTLFQKLIEESNKTSKVDLFNDEQLQQVLSIFDKIESHLSSLKSIISDVGDGEEFSPLLKALNDIKEAASNIKLNFNMDLGDEVSERLNQKVSQASARQLEAYRKLFSAMKGTGKTNKEMLKFFEPDEASVTELIGTYKGIIERAEKQFKVGNSNIYKKYLGAEYDALKREITNANKQLSRADSKRSENGILGDLFGNTKDLSEVIEQLNKIASKLDEISSSASEFKNVFKEGFNVTASVEEIDKLTNRVKELEDELSKIKLNPVSVDKSNISSGTQIEDVIHGNDKSNIDASTTAIKEENDALKQIPNSATEAANAKEKFAKANKEVKASADSSKTSISEEEKYFNSLGKSLTQYQNTLTSISRKPADGNRSQELQEKIDIISSSIEKLNALKSKTEEDGYVFNKNDVDTGNQLEKTIKKNIELVKQMSAAQKGSDALSRGKEIDTITKYLNKFTGISKQAKRELNGLLDQLQSGDPSVNVKKIHERFLELTVAERNAGREARNLFDIFKDKKIYSFLGQAASMFSFYDLIRYGREGIDTIREFDDGLTKISYTMDMTKSQLDNLGNSVLDMASDMKSSIDDAMQVAQIYANMQTSAEEIQRLSEPTLILSNLSGFDSSTIADDIQAVTQQFDILAEDSMHIADVYDYISRNIAVDYSKGLNAMAEGLQVAGSTAKQAGLSYEQTASIIAKAVEKTRLEGSQVGNGLKTIMTRLSKVGELSEEVDNETLSQASESLKKVGIEVYNLDGSYREFDVIMGELAGKWGDLTDAEKSNISFNIAATRQTNLLSAVLSNFSDSMQLAEEATNANGSALENQQKYMESFSGHLQSLETEAKIAWLNILDSETLKDGVDLLTGLVKVVGQLVDTFGLLGTAAGIGGIVAGFKNVGINTLVAY